MSGHDIPQNGALLWRATGGTGVSAPRRRVISLSLSPSNPAAVRLEAELVAANIPERQQSQVILAWLMDYFDGRARAAWVVETIADDELDALLDNF